MAQEVLPDVILSDVQMPVMSGEQLAMAVRGNPLLKATPIVMLTARADESLRLRLVFSALCMPALLTPLVQLQTGVQEFLSKPFSLPELM
jgi:CheY-like chemotaxis protein